MTTPRVDAILPNGLLNPDMPAQELRLHMGELTAQEERTARAAIRWANNYQKAHALEICPECDIAGCFHIRSRSARVDAVSDEILRQQPDVLFRSTARLMAEKIIAADPATKIIEQLVKELEENTDQLWVLAKDPATNAFVQSALKIIAATKARGFGRK